MKADDVANLLDEERVGRQLEAPGAVGLDPKQPEKRWTALYEMPEATAAPRTDQSGADRRPAPQQGRQRRAIDATTRLRGDAAAARQRARQSDARGSASDSGQLPGSRGRARGRRGVGDALSRGQYDPRPPHQPMRCRPRPHKLAELGPLKLAQHDLLLARSTHAAPPPTRTSMAQNPQFLAGEPEAGLLQDAGAVEHVWPRQAAPRRAAISATLASTSAGARPWTMANRL